MQYMLMIYSDEALEPTPGTPEHQQYMADYMAFTAWLKDTDAFVDSMRCCASSTSSSARATSRRTVTP